MNDHYGIVPSRFIVGYTAKGPDNAGLYRIITIGKKKALLTEP